MLVPRGTSSKVNRETGKDNTENPLWRQEGGGKFAEVGRWQFVVNRKEEAGRGYRWVSRIRCAGRIS